MASPTLQLTPGCTGNGIGQLTAYATTNPSPEGLYALSVQVYYEDGSPFDAPQSSAAGAASFVFAGMPNGSYYAVAINQDEEESAPVTATVNCTPDPDPPTDPENPVPPGQQVADYCSQDVAGQRVGIYFDAATKAIGIRFTADPACGTGPDAARPADGAVLYGVCDGTTLERVYYRATDAAEYVATANSTACGYVPPVDPPDPIDPEPEPEVPPGACADRDADTYGSTANGGLCVFSPKLTLDSLPDLVPLARPAYVVLHSAEIQHTPPSFSRLSIVVESPAEGAKLLLNGYEFTAGPITQQRRFEGPETLLQALQATPALMADYAAQQVAPEELELIARRPGRGYDLQVSASGAGVAFEAHGGQDMYYATARADWGLWLEVWAVPGAAFGPGQGKGGAVLAGSFEARARADNAYRFDVAPCLRQFTSLDYAVAGRLTGYFLRFGEQFAEQAGGFRKRRKVGESSVLFGLEAVEIVPPSIVVPGASPAGFPYELPIAFDGGGSPGLAAGYRRLSRRPGPVPLAGVLTTLLNPAYAPTPQLEASHRSATGGYSSAADIARLPAGGLLSLLAADAYAPAGTELTQVLNAEDATVLVSTLPEPPPRSQVLTFVNGQGGNESVVLAPVAEPAVKRIARLYPTATGRRTYASELPDARRLTTSLLSQAEYEWLVAELGNSPAVWLETPAGPVPVNLTDFDATADYGKGEFSLSVEIEPTEQPARGLTN